MGNIQTSDGKITKGGKVKGLIKIRGKKGESFFFLNFDFFILRKTLYYIYNIILYKMKYSILRYKILYYAIKNIVR